MSSVIMNNKRKKTFSAVVDSWTCGYKKPSLGYNDRCIIYEESTYDKANGTKY